MGQCSRCAASLSRRRFFPCHHHNTKTLPCPPCSPSSSPAMSGKAPPRAPRALLNSLAASAATGSSSATPTQPSPSTASSSRLGATPPTGPRSLTNARVHIQAPKGPRADGLTNGVNGHVAAAGPSPPTGPSASRYSQKGKHVEIPWKSKASPDPSGVN